MSSSPPASLLDVDLQPGKPPILRVEATGDAAGWAAEHRDALRAVVAEHGAVLVRGLGLRDAAEVSAVFRRLATGLMTEKEAFARRQIYADGVYSSATWPANQPMCMHHELSYRLEFPGLMLFACLSAPTEGGATAVADSPTVLNALPAELVDRFERDGWMLTRSYNDEIGATVAEAFGTEDRGAVESYCRANAIEFEWQPDGGLRTRQRRSAVVRHPVTGQRCWFNQIAFLNEWTIDPEVREYLVDMYGEDGLPFNTRFGNGDPIGEDIVQLLNEVYEANTVREPWQAGDLMLVDNIRTAHSREAYEGPREILVGMADAGTPCRLLADRRGDRRMTTIHPTAAGSAIVRPAHRATVRGDLRCAGPAGAAGSGEGDRGAGRGHLPVAWCRGFGEPAVVFSAFPGSPVGPDHRAAGLDRRAGPGGWPEVDLQFPGERGGRDPAGVGGADPQRSRHRVSVRLPGGLDHQRHQDGRVGGVGGRLAQPRPATPDPGRVCRGGSDRPLHPHLPGRHRLVVRRDRRARPVRRQRGRLPRLPGAVRHRRPGHRARQRRGADPVQRPGGLRHRRRGSRMSATCPGSTTIRWCCTCRCATSRRRSCSPRPTSSTTSSTA